MITLALVGKPFEQQIQTNPEQLSGLEVLYCGEDLAPIQSRRPRVLVLDLQHLGSDPRARLDEFRAQGIERIVVSYGFARRDLVQSLHGAGVQVVQGPLSLSNLRALMTDLLIQDILGGSDDHAGPPERSHPTCPQCGATLETSGASHA